MLTSYRLDEPALDFGDDGVPRSSAFDDVYFDKEAGLDETRYVFLDHNQLPERFENLKTRNFTIAETGFGTGLNFLCALELFQQKAPKEGWLHFISVEKYPISKEKLTESLALWPSLASLAEALITHYPTRCHGFHRIELPEFRTTLTLWFGDAHDGFKALDARVDAWFLDGFAPSKNPDMWSDLLFQHIQRLSHPVTTFATFTAAGIVRRGLQAHGFAVTKVKGFGQKREMMVGQYACNGLNEDHQGSWSTIRSNQSVDRIIIIGSGLAGATTAYTLAQKGVQVTVWEQGEVIACGASGNEQGMLYPKLGATDTPVNRLYLSSYLYAHRFYSHLGSNYDSKPLWKACGLKQIAKNDSEKTKFNKVLASELYPDSVIQAQNESLHLPLSGWVRPKAVIEALLSHPNITVHLNRKLEAIEASPRGFKVFSGKKSYQCSHLVICTANQHHLLNPWLQLPTKAIRGQVSQLDIQTLSKRDQSLAQELTQVLCGDGYVSPALDNQLNFGATYDLHDTSLEINNESHQLNLDKLSALLPLDTSKIQTSQLKGRAALRCTVSDYTPIVGPVSETKTLLEQFATLRTNAKWQSKQAAQLVDGLYINIGHGSRGLVSAPLCASYLSSLILKEPCPIEISATEALHPNRFTIRQLKKGEA